MAIVDVVVVVVVVIGSTPPIRSPFAAMQQQLSETQRSENGACSLSTPI